MHYAPDLAQLTLHGAPDGIRTHGPQIRNLVLYPAELRAHAVLLAGSRPLAIS
jgi:hypothetical protein